MKAGQPSNQTLMAELEVLREKSTELSHKFPEKAAIILTAWMRQVADVRRITEQKPVKGSPRKAG